MLSRAFRSGPLLRSFSGGHDPYWLHLHHTKDNYPQYAHLHWHTFDPHEIGKYAKLRSKEHFGSHVSEDPAPIDWFPEMGDYRFLDKDSRDALYFEFNRWGHRFIPFLQENVNYEHEGDHRLIEDARDAVLSVLKPKQVQQAIGVAKNLIEEYKAAGVPVTREAVETKVRLYLLKNLTKHQAHDVQGNMMELLEDFGFGNPMNED
jgi:hypothetical protein